MLFVKFGISLVFIDVLLVYANPNGLSRLFECGDEGTRTPDLRLAKAPLSQLSYIPRKPSVGLGGLEPPTSRLSGVRSNQLSYRPGYLIWKSASRLNARIVRWRREKILVCSSWVHVLQHLPCLL